MSFDPSVISGVVLSQVGPEVHLAWTSASAGPFQVYADKRLVWSGHAKACTIPRPPSRSNIHVGAVAETEVASDLSSTLDAPAGTGDRATLAWLGGTYLADDIAGFRVYGSTAPGGAISYAAPLATLAAYPSGIVADGYGEGGYGDGGYGQSASSYSWTSARLMAGTWQFEVRPFDAAGNARTGNPTASITIAAPPGPPARNAAGKRLTYTYNAGTSVPTLNWLASPG